MLWHTSASPRAWPCHRPNATQSEKTLYAAKSWAIGPECPIVSTDLAVWTGMVPHTCRILGPRPGSRGPKCCVGRISRRYASSAALSARARQLTRQALEREASYATGWRRRGALGQRIFAASSCARRERGLPRTSGTGAGRRGRGGRGARASAGNAAAVDGFSCSVYAYTRY